MFFTGLLLHLLDKFKRRQEANHTDESQYKQDLLPVESDVEWEAKCEANTDIHLRACVGALSRSGCAFASRPSMDKTYQGRPVFQIFTTDRNRFVQILESLGPAADGFRFEQVHVDVDTLRATPG